MNVNKQMTDVELWLLYSNTWNHLTVCKKDLGLIKNVFYKTCLQFIYIYKEDMALSNQQWLIYHKTKPNQIIYI